MTNEYFLSVTAELHALNSQVHALLLSTHSFVPEWGLTSALRQLLTKHIPDGLAVSRGVIIHEGQCSELVEVLIYRQDEPLLHQAGDVVFVPSQSVCGLLSVMPESGDLIGMERRLHTLGQAVSMIPETPTGAPCFAGVLGYATAALDADELATMLECIAAEYKGTPISDLCMVDGDSLFLKSETTSPGWEIRPAGNHLPDFFRRLMLAITPEKSAEAIQLERIRNGIRKDQLALASQEVPNGQALRMNGNGNAGTVAVGTAEAESTRKRSKFFQRFPGKKHAAEKAVAESVPATEPVAELPAQGLDKQDRNGNTHLHNAVLEGVEQQLIELLRQGANINIKNKEGNTPLHLVALNNQLAIARILLDHGADINARNYAYCTPLHLASAENHDHIARILLDYGAELEARNNRSLTPLHRAAMCGSLLAAEVLVAFGADLHALTEKDMMPLHLAAWYGQVEVLQLLLDSHADMNAQNADGNTALHLAAFNSQVKAIKLLINNNVNMEIANHLGETYLQRINEGYQNERVLVLED